MRAGDREYFLGCSGYFYWGWRGKFYPKDLKPARWLGYYAEHFNSVEINSTFYNFPKVSSMKRLYRETPRSFVFSVKANRSITHMKKFKETKELVDKFYDIVAQALSEKLGCILFQLPPSYRYTEENIERILSQLRPEFTNVVEFRHPSWWREEVYRKLRNSGVVFCSVSSPNLPEDLVETTEVVYVRFHGKEGWYRYNYSEEELRSWAEKISRSSAVRVFAYFNNDYNAYAPFNCLKLMELLGVKPYREVS